MLLCVNVSVLFSNTSALQLCENWNMISKWTCINGCEYGCKVTGEMHRCHLIIASFVYLYIYIYITESDIWRWHSEIITCFLSSFGSACLLTYSMWLSLIDWLVVHIVILNCISDISISNRLFLSILLFYRVLPLILLWRGLLIILYSIIFILSIYFYYYLLLLLLLLLLLAITISN